MTSEKHKHDARLQISILGKYNGILISRGVIYALHTPTHICILKGADKRSVAVAACEEREYLSFRVPEDFLSLPGRKLRVYSRAFVTELLRANDLAPGRTHVVAGTYSARLNAVVFALKVL